MSKFNQNTKLSTAGHKRRLEMLNELQKEVVYAKQNRNQKVVLSVLAFSLMACVIAAIANDGWRQIKPNVVDQTPHPVVAAQESTNAKSNGTMEKFSLTQVSLEMISDEQLLNALEEMGQRSTIAIIGDEEVVVSQVEL